MRKVIIILKHISLVPFYFFYFLYRIALWCYVFLYLTRLHSYYPEEKRKNRMRVLFELFFYHNPFYFLYGFDRKIANKEYKKQYVTEKVFWNTSDKLNGLNCSDHNLCVAGSRLFLLRDKFEFYFFMRRYCIPTPEVLGVIIDGIFYDINLNKADIRVFKDYFVKDVDGQCASFVKHFNDYSEFQSYKNYFSKGKFLVQKRVIQSDCLNKLNPFSINTLRIVTVYNNGNPVVFSSVLRVGTKETKDVDNWAVGGFSVGVKEGGVLDRYGFLKHSSKKGGKETVHPDTGIVFDGFKIDLYEEACKLACSAHKKLFGVYSIGWDIAISKDGPVIIEGNDNWEISLMQASNGGLLNKFKKYFCAE